MTRPDPPPLPETRFPVHIFLLATTVILLTGCPDTGPEYKEPPIGSPHGTVKVEPVREGKGGGLRAIDDLLVFPRDATADEMPSWKYREWRVKPGMREIEIFGMGNFIRRVVRVREGKRILFHPEKYGDRETRGNRLLVGVYTMSEEDIE